MDPNTQPPANPNTPSESGSERTSAATATDFGAGSPPANQPANLGASENAKISNPKYWLTVYGILAVYVLLEIIGRKVKIVEWIAEIGWLVVLIICYRNVSRLKAAGADQLTKEEKYKMVFFMSVDPIWAQAFFYYRLRKTLPQTARVALKVGWKVFGLQIVVAFIGVVLLTVFNAIPALQNNYSSAQLNGQYTSYDGTFVNDVNKIAADTNNSKANAQTVQADCQTFQNDINKAKALKIANSAQGQAFSQLLSSGSALAKDCMNVASSNFSISSQTNFNNGLNKFHSALQAMANADLKSI